MVNVRQPSNVRLRWSLPVGARADEAAARASQNQFSRMEALFRELSGKIDGLDKKLTARLDTTDRKLQELVEESYYEDEKPQPMIY